ncbi:adenine deaminase [Paenibacillus sp. MWE-103]|uniref:Adenine deaminase n=1 Tax=Paenibacillus artemisiicola TaxID=1172618 RepID=A0ABS3W346_9BACL|nr:adenine deaminase [Paenibacillus artemisiicola]MBO7742729.1 adenine deaminase [Paenibacillus artemisiicola]
MEQTNRLKRLIEVAAKREPADLVIKNGKIVNVFTGTVTEGDVAIADGRIAGIGAYAGKETVDAGGRHIAPGFIDGHVHIESSMLTPREFAKVLLRHGVTAAVTDPHEIANVAGTDGLDYMLRSAEGLPLDIFVLLPSCVPATPFETNGARLEAEQLAPYYGHPKVLGLAEVMNFPAVAGAEPGMLGKLAGAEGRHIDGHAAGIGRESLNVYAASGILTDHECVTADEARDRLELGFYLMIREGTVAKNLAALLPAVTPRNARRCLFVTDDKLPGDLIEEGSVDHIVRLAIRSGLDPVTAIQMATINAAECFGLRGRGAVAPGYAADLLLLDDLEEVRIRAVYKDGVQVAERDVLREEAFPLPDAGESGDRPSSVAALRVKPVAPKDLELPLNGARCNVIGIVPNQIVTRRLLETVDVRDGRFAPSVAKDLLKLAVVERHHATGNIGLAIVKGFKLRKGALASTVSHDSHNLVVVGASDEDMLAAIAHLAACGGGLAVVADGRVTASLPLPVAGLMSDRPHDEVYAGLRAIKRALADIGAPDDFDPFLTLSFLTLPVIPSLKLTDRGLFDFEAFGHIAAEAGGAEGPGAG